MISLQSPMWPWWLLLAAVVWGCRVLNARGWRIASPGELLLVLGIGGGAAALIYRFV